MIPIVGRKVGMKTTEMLRKHHSKGTFLLTVLSALTGNKLGFFPPDSPPLWNARHYFFKDRNSLWLLDMGTSWYFSWKLNYFGIPKWKQGLFNIPQSGHESVYLLEPSFHSRTPNNSTFMKNISWCPCLKVRVNFIPRRNYAAHFTVSEQSRQSPSQ